MNNIATVMHLRPLNPAEISLVAGGTEDEIVVTGTRMTQQQKDAYDSWHSLMTFNVYAVGVVGAGAVAAGGWALGGGAGVFVGVAGEVGLMTFYDQAEQSIDAFIDQETEALYRYDGSDGSYDGYLGYANW